MMKSGGITHLATAQIAKHHLLGLAKNILAISAITGLLWGVSLPAMADDTKMLAQEAKGQTVHFNAWGGSPNINSYIGWVAEQVKARYDINLEHVKLTDTAEAVSRILAEKVAGKTAGGSVDLIWVNGENFATLSREGLLRTDEWAFALPAFKLTDPEALPGLVTDFALPTEGRESAWGRAQLVFGYDSAYLASPPRSAAALKDWIKNNPGRFSYPRPPDFTGSSFLKQILLETTDDISRFQSPPSGDVDTHLAPLFDWLEEVTPHLWRSGRTYPANYTEMVRLLGDGEITIAFAFNPAEFSNAISQQILPDTVRSYIHEDGTLANIHFVAIPFNATSSEGAMLVADFLLSFEAQLRKANPDIWGDPTVLSFAKLSEQQKQAFDALPRGIASLSEAELSPALAEPHPDWMTLIEEKWQAKFAQ